MPPHDLLSRGHDTDRHERTAVGRIRLVHGRVPDPSERKTRSHLVQRCLRRRGQHDGMGACGKITGTGLAGGVTDVRGLDASRQIAPYDDVVRERGGRGANASSAWPRAYGVPAGSSSILRFANDIGTVATDARRLSCADDDARARRADDRQVLRGRVLNHARTSSHILDHDIPRGRQVGRGVRQDKRTK